MSETPQTHHEADLRPDTIIELTSVDDDDPIDLVEGDEWPVPPEDWDPGAHDEADAEDPDVTITEDDAPDRPDEVDPLADSETKV